MKTKSKSKTISAVPNNTPNRLSAADSREFRIGGDLSIHRLRSWDGALISKTT
jgi:hypothetical protein